MTMRLYLFRHGEVVGDDLYFGQFDHPLSERGERQSEAIATYVSGLDVAAIYTSDLGRTKEAGRRAGKAIGLPFSSDSRLRELNLGWAEGLTREEAFEKEPALRKVRYEDLVETPLTEGGETIAELAKRVRELRAELLGRHTSRKVVVVAHNTVNRVLLGDALGLPLDKVFCFRQDFGCVNIIEYGESKARVALLNADPAACGPAPDR